ncbi:MAG: FMN-binding negative transcriptional regulator [Alphaproteobacteria bacterium]|nr:FMN-binding negative transcriptional regulator [Alphaproteobacteria bacterium]
MYVPSHFQEGRIPVLHEAIRTIGFGTLVTLGPDGLEASHVPMLVDPDPAPFGTLRGHVARANEQWKRAADGVHSLAMFLGPNAYVSPSWYATKRETGKVVPTWNYVAVHVYGRPRFFTDRDPLLAIVTRLTTIHEGKRAAPWAVGDAPPDYIDGLLKAIVGFEMLIERLEGKWKLGQNRSAADIAGVRAGLAADPGDAALAALMAKI